MGIMGKWRRVAMLTAALVLPGGVGSAWAQYFPGPVGIGIGSPQSLLDVGGRIRTSRGEDVGEIFTGSSGSVIGFHLGSRTNVPVAFFTNSSGPLVVLDTLGRFGIGTTTPAATLHVAGDATVDGNIAAKYQDVAEWVRAGTGLLPATVVVIDPREIDHVAQATRAYDTTVAGVVSARPGLLLGEPAEGRVKVAHSGRVKVKADASYGAIAIGDLLVTSATPGHAMRSTPIELGGVSLHRPGTVLGKALESLPDGQGEILVLLTLQ